MAQLDAILEELGIAPLWVRRGAGHVHRPGDAEGDALSPARDVMREAGIALPSQPLQATDVTVQACDAQESAAHAPSQASHTSVEAAQSRVEATRAEDSATGPAGGVGKALEGVEAAEGVKTTAASASGAAADAQPVPMLDWAALKARVAGCTLCRLCERRTNTVFGVGDEMADWMLVGEAPGENEDKQGEPFVGQAGKLLDNMLRALQLRRGDNVYIANVLKCRPPGNRNPEPDEVVRCEPYLKRQVALVKPSVIVALGRFAAQSLLKTDASIASLRGRVHEYEGVPVIVTYHPAYLLRSLHDKHKAWSDLCLARAIHRKRTVAH
ncbi:MULTISPECIES: uracil-DNA glycosylase [Burkholderiaceae]|uniref:uracil-DNA glycosylase n=1 Tax=Burkholderiaceae TaxID=119060 RepID=UPI0009657A8C|nr:MULTISPECIES: uracil-DNA glycosylase [Burkholderiaceae]MCF2134600.1 uracil-DNA glycosylase [Mycetohabitans sp. B3]MCG1040743.1 uracil-DNA glycosylase [Mycetohabitans sp. B7]SIT65369.1 DNA polymerase [Burkholderia sp. b14]